MHYLHTSQTDFTSQLEQLTTHQLVDDPQVTATVTQIINQVRQQGDSVLIELTNKFDQRQITAASQLEISLDQAQQALENITSQDRQALEHAVERIKKYHSQHQHQSWQYQESDGTRLGQQITAIEKVGIYAPGGTASYPSSVLMNAVPAKIAGVEQIILTVPAPKEQLNPLVLAAAALAGVDKIFTLGGAQAIAALAYGTPLVPKVHKIVGPGNIWAATAKRLVFGQVGIDMLAGPSEILIISDGSVPAAWLAADLMAQAEHDPQAQAILIGLDKASLQQVEEEIERLIGSLERQDIIRQSLTKRGIFIQAESIAQAIQISNKLAPEHLELAVAAPEKLLSQVRNAGAIFLGAYTCETLGDYCAGPNHTLPTSGTATFSSPLGVYDFQKRSSVIYANQASAQTLGKTAAILANNEGLSAHALAATYRMNDTK